MSYTTSDFSESVSQTPLRPQDIARVVAAWGSGSGQGTDAGHWKWSAEDVTDWAGGFLLQLYDNRFAYLTGWCDFTGWGCQDGVDLKYFNTRPTIPELRELEMGTTPPQPDEWDLDPADLNRWLATNQE